MTPVLVFVTCWAGMCVHLSLESGSSQAPGKRLGVVDDKGQKWMKGWYWETPLCGVTLPDSCVCTHSFHTRCVRGGRGQSLTDLHKDILNHKMEVCKEKIK